MTVRAGWPPFDVWQHARGLGKPKVWIAADFGVKEPMLDFWWHYRLGLLIRPAPDPRDLVKIVGV